MNYYLLFPSGTQNGLSCTVSGYISPYRPKNWLTLYKKFPSNSGMKLLPWNFHQMKKKQDKHPHWKVKTL